MTTEWNGLNTDLSEGFDLYIKVTKDMSEVESIVIKIASGEYEIGLIGFEKWLEENYLSIVTALGDKAVRIMLRGDAENINFGNISDWISDVPNTAAINEKLNEVALQNPDYKWLDTYSKLYDAANDLSSLINAVGDIQFAILSLENYENDEEGYRQAVKNISNGVFDISNVIIGHVPVIGDLISAQLDVAKTTFNSGFNVINGYINKLEEYDALCDEIIYGAEDNIEDLRATRELYDVFSPFMDVVDDSNKEELKKQMEDISVLLDSYDEAYEAWEEHNENSNGEWDKSTTEDTTEATDKNYDESSDAEAPRDPLVIDLGKSGIELTNVENGVHFDLDKNELAEKTAWIGAEDGFLVLDRNGNGIIDDGGELFGDQVVMSNGETASSGFEALADLDDNVNESEDSIGDGVIDEKDAEFSNLRVWVDKDHDGITDEGELKTLEELGITSISLDHTDKNAVDTETGTIVTESSVVNFIDGTTSEISEHWFEVKSYDTEERDEQGNPPEVDSVEAFGNVKSLNTAIAEDETGELGTLVELFKISSDYLEKRLLIKKILYFITGANEIAANSRGGNIDARCSRSPRTNFKTNLCGISWDVTGFSGI